MVKGTVILALALLVAPAALHAAAGSRPAFVVSHQDLALPGAERLAELARDEALRRGEKVSLAVVDRNGRLLCFLRIDGAAPVTIRNAIAKAGTAAQLRTPSATLERTVDGGKPSYLAIAGVVPLKGGVPVFFKGALVGGIASSGASADVDEAIAASALAKWTAELGRKP